MTTIRERYGLAEVTAHRVTGLASVVCPHVIKSPELIGIEVEIENVVELPGNPNKAWQIIEDGSLRNNGREFITKPVAASNAPVLLEYLMNGYLAKNCCFSPRTSVHVHLNMQDFTTPQVIDFVMLYSLFEKLFYKFCGRGRVKNIYCVPLIDTDLLANLGEKNLEHAGWSKYTGLNLLPLQQYGTVEFRHMHGTRDVGKLCVWINLITKLKEYVRAHSTKDIRNDVINMTDDYAFGELLYNIFGEYTEVFKFEGLNEVTYLPAKQALSVRHNTDVIRGRAVNTSEFYKFKEQ
jgi:hypothetical protein